MVEDYNYSNLSYGRLTWKLKARYKKD